MNYNEKIAYSCELLINYAEAKHLIDKRDTVFARNHLISVLLLDKPYDGVCSETPTDVSVVLEALLDEVASDSERSPVLLPENNDICRDLLDTAVMGCLVEWPSVVESRFALLESTQGSKAATDYFYSLALDSNYIRQDRIRRNKIWTYDSRYAALTITINLTKPEKDPKEIERLKSLPAVGYPKCNLCPENEGYRGNQKSPARQNHRVIPLTLNGESWSLQYSPYVYFNEHCIVLRNAHVPMKIEHDSFVRLIEFCKRFPHYFIGSNADLPIVGGSILGHDHFQGGNAVMPMFTSKPICDFKSEKYPSTSVSIMDWPMSTIKLVSSNTSELVEAAYEIHSKWIPYQDESNEIIPYTGTKRHNTTTPIVRREGDSYAIYLVLRNNRTSDEHKMGIFHPHEEWHHIKYENIGLIEVMGYFILPGRLNSELEILSDAMVLGTVDSLTESSPAFKHKAWAKEILSRTTVTRDNIIDVLHKEVGIVCTHVLEDSGVFKTSEKGLSGFVKFLSEAVGYRQL